MLNAGRAKIVEYFSNKELRSENAFQTITATFLQRYYGEKGLWSESPQTTKILIGAKTAHNLDVTDFQSKILVGRGPVRFMQVGGIGNRAGGSNGERTYKDQITAPVTVHCINEEEGRVSDLASDVFEFIGFLRLELREFGMFRIEVPTMGEMGYLAREGHTRTCVVPITFTAYMDLHWRVTENAPELKAVDFTGCS